MCSARPSTKLALPMTSSVVSAGQWMYKKLRTLVWIRFAFSCIFVEGEVSTVTKSGIVVGATAIGSSSSTSIVFSVVFGGSVLLSALGWLWKKPFNCFDANGFSGDEEELNRQRYRIFTNSLIQTKERSRGHLFWIFIYFQINFHFNLFFQNRFIFCIFLLKLVLN